MLARLSFADSCPTRARHRRFQASDAECTGPNPLCDLFPEHDATLGHLHWPAKPLNLNPTENLWDYLEQQIKLKNKLHKF